LGRFKPKTASRFEGRWFDVTAGVPVRLAVARAARNRRKKGWVRDPSWRFSLPVILIWW
jgi:hypothetical protein